MLTVEEMRAAKAEHQRLTIKDMRAAKAENQFHRALAVTVTTAIAAGVAHNEIASALRSVACDMEAEQEQIAQMLKDVSKAEPQDGYANYGAGA